jgi:hypothetical protein
LEQQHSGGGGGDDNADAMDVDVDVEHQLNRAAAASAAVASCSQTVTVTPHRPGVESDSAAALPGAGSAASTSIPQADLDAQKTRLKDLMVGWMEDIKQNAKQNFTNLQQQLDAQKNTSQALQQSLEKLLHNSTARAPVTVQPLPDFPEATRNVLNLLIHRGPMLSASTVQEMRVVGRRQPGAVRVV